MGFSSEFQTGDQNFDKSIYIASDHYFFGEHLRGNTNSRSLILKLIEGGFIRIWSDGHWLYVRSRDKQPKETWLPVIDELRNEVRGVVSQTGSVFSDSFARKTIIVESLIWFIATYGIVSYFELAMSPSDYHTDHQSLIIYGVVFSIITLVLLLSLIVFYLKRSSRSHRVLVESALVLSLALPGFGIQAVSDINRKGDTSDPIFLNVAVTKKWSKLHRGKGGRTWRSYHMQVEDIDHTLNFSPNIRISRAVFDSLSEGKSIPVGLRRGFLGLNWFQSINGISY